MTLTSAETRILLECLNAQKAHVSDALTTMHARNEQANACTLFRDWLTHARTLTRKLEGKDVVPATHEGGPAFIIERSTP